MFRTGKTVCCVRCAGEGLSGPACLPRRAGIRCFVERGGFRCLSFVCGFCAQLSSLIRGRRGRRVGRLFSFTGFRTTLPSERLETTNRSPPTSTISILVTVTIRYFSKLLSRPHDCSITIAGVIGLGLIGFRTFAPRRPEQHHAFDSC